MRADALQYLLDRAEVSDAVKRFFIALDRFDWAGVEREVADEFTLVANAPGTVAAPVPRAEFMRTLKARNGGFTGTIHLNPDHLVTVDGDRAHVTAHMWAAHMVGPDPKDVFWGYGIYEIDLIRDGERWLLSSQRIDMVRGEGEGDPADVFARAMARQDSGQGHY
ncbi:nuclear transport factor 2 family protein [Streptomyces sp. NPDC091217]|uniref:nuclear transport factor 2 family protein n=1 Tax=Streptomyces sp. NPDC091217 TaxID=3365975 RepID=UPI0038060E16